jgi:hypothetical protein
MFYNINNPQETPDDVPHPLFADTNPKGNRE